MKKITFLGMILGFLAANCLAQSPQAPDKSPPVALQSVQAAPQTVYTTPQVVQQDPLYAPRVVAIPQLVQPYAFQQSYGFATNFAVGNHCNVNQFGVNRFAFNHGFAVNRFNTGNVTVSAVDRRGTQVVASGANRVRIERGLFGRIRGARAN